MILLICFLIIYLLYKGTMENCINPPNIFTDLDLEKALHMNLHLKDNIVTSDNIIESKTNENIAKTQKLTKYEKQIKRNNKGLCGYIHGKEKCKKKLKLHEKECKCKCNIVYCRNHVYEDKHHCTYDYKKDHKENLTKNNPIVVAKKLEKL